MYNAEQLKTSHEKEADRSEVIAKSLRDFIRSNKMNAQQVEDAYFFSIDHDSTDIDENDHENLVVTLARQFSDAEKEGFALNEIGDIVSEMQRRTGAPEQLLTYINSFPVDDRSRRLLRSIFEQNRVGEIRFVDPTTLKYIGPKSMRLPNAFKSLSAEERAEKLFNALSRVVKHFGNKIFGIEFSEEG